MNNTSRCEIKDKFYIDGKPLQIISGSIHYFRVVPEYWQDRLEKLKAMGCNCVETYIPWNFHEPEKGIFQWDGIHDFCHFIELAQNLGLYVIVRPSPYICAEWEWGGLPSWLMAQPGLRLRCSDPEYLHHVEEYYTQLIPRLVPYQIDNGGKIILVQIENEYGYYGDDSAYMQFLADLMRRLGITVPFVTSDGPWSKHVYLAGQVPGVLPSGNFGSACQWQFDQMKKMNPKRSDGGDYPLLNMEFWAGWFDAWGNKKKKSSKLKINELDYDYVLKNGHNINIYMFHGGTNFGFMNGANYYGKLTADTTSYDYDAPLSEDGQITEKYKAFQNIIRKRLGESAIPKVDFSTKIERRAFGKFEYQEKACLFENLEIMCGDRPLAIGDRSPEEKTASGGCVIKSPFPISMEEAGQNYGYILYKTKLRPNEDCGDITFKKCADRVQCFADGKLQFTAFDKEICSEQKGHWPLTFKEGKVWNIHAKEGACLDFLVENLGRVNFGHKLEEQKKGISEDVLINTHAHYNWDIYTLPLDEVQMQKLLSKGKWQSCGKNCGEGDSSPEKTSENRTAPAFFKFDFNLEVPSAAENAFADTYLDFDGWGKGCVWVNGFNIGRFWDWGPQKTLYIPGPLLKNGKNQIVIFETEGKRSKNISLCDKMKWIK